MRVDWREFERHVRKYFGEKLDREFAEVSVPVGPDHEHKFDCVSADGEIVMECKSYTWTDGGNFPSAKISTANEAILFLSRVPAERKLLVMQDDLSDDGTSLVQTYVNRYSGVMDDIEVWRYRPQAPETDGFEQVRAADSRGVERFDLSSSTQSRTSNAHSFTGKYAPLYEELADASTDTIELTFDEIDALLGEPLPASAKKYRAWWNASGHSHAEDWESIGWTVTSLDLADETVTFETK